METTLLIGLVLTILIVSASVALELVTLQRQMYKAYSWTKPADQILRNNWRLVFIYGLIAVIATPITIISVVFNMRETWEKKLYSSIKNNLYIKEKV